jgi:hypothetical protein
MSNRSLRKRNRSLDAPAPKFRILKIHRAETGADIRGFWCETSDIPRQRPGPSPLTLVNVDAPPSAGNGRRDTAVAGWAERIRTALCPIRAGLSNGRIRTCEQAMMGAAVAHGDCACGSDHDPFRLRPPAFSAQPGGIVTRSRARIGRAKGRRRFLFYLQSLLFNSL